MSYQVDVISRESKNSTAFEKMLQTEAGQALARAYPGYTWGIDVNEETGMWYLVCVNFSGNWGFKGRVDLIYSPSSFRAEVLKAAGGILEFFGARRSEASQIQIAEAKTDFAGRTLALGFSDKTFEPRKYSFPTK